MSILSKVTNLFKNGLGSPPQSSDQAQINPIEESFRVLQQAIKQSQEILGQAELDSLKMASTHKFYTRKIEQQTEKDMQGILQWQKTEVSNSEAAFNKFLEDLKVKANESMRQMETQAMLSQQQFNSFITALKTHSEKNDQVNLESLNQKVNSLFEDFETKLADFLLQSEQKMMLAVDLELRSARSLIDTYKVQQMNVVDENIVAMLERTLSLVLAKNLSLKDQMDFVYDSLEKAKAEKFIV